MLLNSVSSDMIIAESKNTSNQHTIKFERECFLFFFFGAMQVLTFCIKFASDRLPAGDPSWSYHGLLLLQKNEHQLHCLVNINQPQMHFLPTWSLLPKLQSIISVSRLSCILAWHINLFFFPQYLTNVKWMSQMGCHQGSF